MRPPAQDESLLTIAEYEKLPKEDAYRVDLVRGMLVRSPRPVSLHGWIAARLIWHLYSHVESKRLGVVLAEVGAILARDPDTVRGPDIAFYSRERIPEGGFRTSFWGPPDLAVEIHSLSNCRGALMEKLADYFAAGVRAVWVVDPRERTITVHEAGVRPRALRETETLTGDDVLPGFRLPLATFFAL